MALSKKERAIENEIRYMRLYNRYKLLALDCFEWFNLPNNMESRFIEEKLYETGQVFFYQHEMLGLICLPCSSTGNLNVYNEPTTLNITGVGMTEMRGVGEGVRILNNDLSIPTDIYVREYAERMCETEKSIIANVKQQKFPYVITCDENTRFTMLNVFKNVEDGDPVIFGKKNLDVNGIKYFGLNTPYVVDKLTQYQQHLENEILSFFGLNNAKNKKERLLVDEVNANNDFIDRNIELMYKTRKMACEKINKKFGLDIKVIKKNNIYEEGEK